MGHRPPTLWLPAHTGHAPPPPPRLVSLYSEGYMLDLVKRAYVQGEIDDCELERGIAHVLHGGWRTPDFPYLPPRPMGNVESLR